MFKAMLKLKAIFENSCSFYVFFYFFQARNVTIGSKEKTTKIIFHCLRERNRAMREKEKERTLILTCSLSVHFQSMPFKNNDYETEKYWEGLKKGFQ